MTKKDLVLALESVPDDAIVRVCLPTDLAYDEVEELEPGSLLEIDDTGFVSNMHVIYARPT